MMYRVLQGLCFAIMVILSWSVVVAFALPAVQQYREAGRREQVSNNLKQFKLALDNYDKHHPRSLNLAAETVKGKVQAAGDGKITIVDKDNEETEFEVPDSAEITRNGKEASLSDLEEGDSVEITTVKKGNKVVAKAIAARSSE